jgi:zinc transport system permease protein
MTDFLHALTDPGIPFLRYALVAGVLASVAFGMMGAFVVARRISYIAGAISHSVLGGIGAALYLSKVAGLGWCTPMLGAVVSALLAAAILGLVSLYAREREDTAIGAVWATGMAAGLLFIAKTPGYIDPMSYLFGNILLISKADLWLVALLDALVIVLGVFYYQKMLAVCFDEEFARVRGLRVERYYLLLLGLTALTVVLLVSVVGIVMVIALLTLPAAVGGHLARRLWQVMVLAVAFCVAFTVAGLWFSYSLDLPSGPSIILFAAVTYLIVISTRTLRHRRPRRESNVRTR